MEANHANPHGSTRATGASDKGGGGMKYLSRRWSIIYLLFIVRACQTGLRQTIGMTLVCMSHLNTSDVTNGSFHGNRTFVSGFGNVTLYQTSVVNGSGEYEVVTSTSSTLPRAAASEPPPQAQSVARHHEFSWSSTFEGHVLVAYYYGFLLTVLLAGYVDRWLGSVATISLGLVLGATVNLLTPLLTRQHHALLVLLRVLTGSANGIIDPAVLSLLARWSPVSEIGQLAAVEYGGVAAGAIFTFMISAFLCEIPYDNGWPFVFYFYGGCTLLFAGLWTVLASNGPESHPSISQAELKFITDNRNQMKDKEKVKPPWLKILGSRPVWAIIVAHVSNLWVFSWVLAYTPMFMEGVLHYELSQNGTLSSLPFIGRMVVGIGAGYVADKMLRHRCSIATVRKILQMAGSGGCALPIFIISFLSHEQRNWAVACLVLSVSLQNTTSVAYRINALDIAPRYAGFLMGMTSAIASAVTLTGPYITSAILVTKSREEWQCVLYIVTAVSVLGGLFFVLFASGDLQQWAKGTEIQVTVEMEGLAADTTKLPAEAGRNADSKMIIS